MMWEMSTLERRYSVPPSTISDPTGRNHHHPVEDLHAWSIYRQNINSGFTDSALGSSEKSSPPYGNFKLRESTVHSILSHPKYGPGGRRHAAAADATVYSYLKFGLPRVFPPRAAAAARDGSSGYDSSDDGHGRAQASSSPAAIHRANRFRRSRSDPDFRQQVRARRPDTASEVSGHSSYWRDKQRQKSSSEANLLTSGARQGSSVLSTRSSRAGAFNAPPGFYSRETSQLLNEKFFWRDQATTFLGDVEGGVFKHPHLQARNLSYEVSVDADVGCLGRKSYGHNRLRLLDSVTFEVHGGEILAVMSTSEDEGTILLQVLANCHEQRHARIRGDLVVNGVPAQPDKLNDRVTFVQQDCSYMADMSVRQTLLFTSLLKEPGNPSRGFDTKGRINALIEDLGLGLVKHTRVKHLTLSEKRRLNVACHLLLDTDIVLLDQPTKGMDIFDTFFLVEYLRQWAARGRIVILTIHPPTYEIFTMMSKIALISAGSLMYFGKRREMLPYFAFIEFPCPAYKNPSDYYLDLVTLDNLSAEAMLESSERIKLLGDTFRHRQEQLSDPGPPGIPPPKVKPSNMLVQILALWIRALIYMFPYNLINLGKNIFVVGVMSMLIGAIYDSVRLGTEQDAAMDRLGFHYVMMTVAIWPLVLLTVTEVWYNKDAISRDLNDRLYSYSAYVISKMTYSFLTAFGVFLAYVIPAYGMSGLKNEQDNVTFSVYLGYMLLYLTAVRTLSMAMAFTFDSRHAAAAAAGLVLTAMALCCGYPVHFADLSVVVYWFKWVSPTRWIMEQVDIWDVVGYPTSQHHREVFTCSSTPPIVAPSAAIILKPPCNFASGAELLKFYDFDLKWPVYVPIAATLAFAIFWFVWSVVCFNRKRQQRKKSNSKLWRMSR